VGGEKEKARKSKRGKARGAGRREKGKERKRRKQEGFGSLFDYLRVVIISIHLIPHNHAHLSFNFNPFSFSVTK